MVVQEIYLRQAVANAVELVNANPGHAAVLLRFREGDFAELDFVANSALLEGEKFVFTAGFDTFDGSIRELADIKAQLIA